MHTVEVFEAKNRLTALLDVVEAETGNAASPSRIRTSTTQLAEQHRLTAQDACYLELALRLDLPLATGDKQLMAAARASGVTLLLAG